MKNETLIISGLGNLADLCSAAAAALRHFKDARLLFSSMAALPDILAENRPKKGGEVHLLGIGLTGDPPRLKESLEACRTAGTRVFWHSVIYPFPEDLKDVLGGLLEDKFSPNATSLVEGIAARFNVEAEDLKAMSNGKPKGADAKAWLDRIDAVDWNFSNTRDYSHLEHLSRDLAGKLSSSQWDPATQRLIAACARWGNRELEVVGPMMKALRKDIVRVAKSDAARVLITGENGTGKETVAMIIHVQSGRTGPFLSFNCATVSRDILESRLFGHAKGSFTGANENRPGLFREADGGTLFLDEIGELPLDMQGLLLRVLQDGRVQGVGETREVAVDVRVVAATNRDLAALVRKGLFREDLYFRLALVELHVPPLRERTDELPTIAANFWKKNAPGRKALSSTDIAALAAYDWPGNVRELHNVLERAALFPNKTVAKLVAEEAEKCISLKKETPAPAAPVAGADKPTPSIPAADAAVPAPCPVDSGTENLDVAIRAHILNVIARHHGNRTEAARALGISRGTLRAHLNNVKM